MLQLRSAEKITLKELEKVLQGTPTEIKALHAINCAGMITDVYHCEMKTGKDGIKRLVPKTKHQLCSALEDIRNKEDLELSTRLPVFMFARHGEKRKTWQQVKPETLKPLPGQTPVPVHPATVPKQPPPVNEVRYIK